jgi:hypothetical protein
MRSVKTFLVATAGLAFGLSAAGGASALTLADLTVPRASFDAGNGVSYEQFEVRIKGKGLSADLSDYEVVSTADGFMLMGDFNESGKGGKIRLEYEVTGPALVGASLSIDVGSGSQFAASRITGAPAPRVAAKGRGREDQLKVTSQLFDSKKLDKLSVPLKNGGTSDAAVFDALTSLKVREGINVKGESFFNGNGSAVSHSFTVPVPEPTTASMLAAGLAGLAVVRGRSR